ncbi:MAG: CDP-alcohol phosphatidyltransferase family protein, partial [Candidatus Borkfalkiaceae bacterium]|nr:CDP-alcohol phosphatidyltransferase family protein [Christensenellaceae bacterium]
MKKRSEKREVRRILNAANGLTALRAVGSIPLLFLPCGSLPFTIVYTLAGLTDALDGPIARRTGTAGKTG